MIKHLLKRNVAVRRAAYWVALRMAKAQSDEAEIIERFTIGAPQTFIEFGFHLNEFNCLQLVQEHGWHGLLVDGGEQQVADANFFFPKQVRAVQKFLTLDNIDFLKEAFPEVGVLSIDVDGNDYWFLERLIDIGPSLISVEYNSTLGFDPITVPYDPNFDRDNKHPRGWYHGASLAALSLLCARYGYGLAAVSKGGTNAFFTRDGNLDPASAWRPNSFREKFSGIGHDAQWASVSNLPFVTVR